MTRERGIMLFNLGGGGVNAYGNPLPMGIVNAKIGNAVDFVTIGTDTYFKGSEKTNISKEKITVPTTYFKRQEYILAKDELREWYIAQIIKPESWRDNSGKINSNNKTLVLQEHANADLLAKAIAYYEANKVKAVQNGS
jgi:hypothetical protein